MSNILDIARSGLMAYRTAMTVTSENVANVGTAGYSRRDVSLEALRSSRSSPDIDMGAASMSGGGVTVDDVRRAFDALAADRLRGAQSALSASSTRLETAKGIEESFVPGANGIGGSIEGFFDSVASLASDPSDLGLRRVVLQEAGTVADQFRQVAENLESLRETVTDMAKQAGEHVANLLGQIGKLNIQMSGLRSSSGAAAPYHDRRDQLLNELSTELLTNVTLDESGRATVRLGEGPGGALLVGVDDIVDFRVITEDGMRLGISVGDGAEIEAAIPRGGAIAGYFTSLGAVASTQADLNDLANRLVNDINSALAGGVDLNGLPGGALFALNGTEVTRNPNNFGTSAINVSGHYPAIVTVQRDQVAGLWRASIDGQEVANGPTGFSLPGLKVSFEGVSGDGDQFVLTPRDNRALNMHVVMTDPRALGAASPSVTSALPANRGTGSIDIQTVTRPAAPLPLMSDLLSSTAADAITLIAPGPVGIIPAGTTSLDLMAMGRQASLDWSVSDTTLAAGGTLSFSIAGTMHSFALPAGLTAAELADGLNDGSVVSNNGASFSDLGVRAGGVDGQFSIYRNFGNFGAINTLTLGGVASAGFATVAEPASGDLQIFTRSGRQIAGTPLSATAAGALLTASNGFLPEAVYSAEVLNGSTGVGYRATDVVVEKSLGQQTIILSPDASGVFPIGTMTVASRGVSAGNYLPEGANAARAAFALNASLPGIEAKATTQATLGDVSDGVVTFSIEAANLSPLTVTALVDGGDLSDLAAAIDQTRGETGLTVSLSPEKDRILLTQANGETIHIAGFTHSAGGQMTLAAVDEAGIRRDPPIMLGQTGLTYGNVVGQVAIRGSAEFQLQLGATVLRSEPDAMVGGLISRQIDQGAAIQRFVFNSSPEADIAATGLDGLSALADPTRFNLSVSGQDFSASGASTGAEVASALAAAMRANAPDAVLYGNAVTTLPREGAAIEVSLDGATYRLRMSGGVVQVEGPEDDRISAAFGDDGRLAISVTGVTDGAVPRLTSNNTFAEAFGFASPADVTQELTGEVVDPSTLPNGSTFTVRLGDQYWTLGLSENAGALNLDIPAGFPGSAQITSDNRVQLGADASLGQLRVLPGAEAVGLQSLEVGARVENGALVLSSTEGQPFAANMSVDATVQQRLHLSNLPPEDLIVVMTGPGALRLAGSVGQFEPVDPAAENVEIRVLDAASGLIGIVDTATGHSISQARLDGNKQVTLGDRLITLTGSLATGDGFRLSSTANVEGDSRVLQRIGDLALSNPSSGMGGFSRILSEILSSNGEMVRAETSRQTSLITSKDTAERKVAEATAVDLDTEAARLIELQQAYQASAQAMSIGRQLFDTLLNLM